MNETEQTVLHLLDTYQATVLAKDVDGFVALYDADVCIFDLWGPWSYAGANGWRAMVANWLGSLGSESVVVDFDESAVLVSGDLASLHTFITYQSLSADGEVLRAMQNRLTWVLRRKDDAWKIVHEHTSAPADVNSLKVTLKREASHGV
jgi:uncharacterized protein (TIGR02246 family)